MKKFITLALLLFSIGIAAQEDKDKSKPEVKEYFIFDMSDKFLKLSDKTREGTAKKLDSLGNGSYKLMKVYDDGTSIYCTYEGTKNTNFLKSI